MRFRILITLAAACCCISANAEKVVLGKLGQAVKATAIHSRPNTLSHVYYRVKPYQYLVVQTTRNPNYLRVLLTNDSYGYVSAEAVAKLPYNVTADRDAAPSARSYRDTSTPASRSDLARYALNFEGTPYKWGGNDPRRGIDCSGFVKFLYGQIGMDLPRTAAQQAMVGTPVRRLEDLQPGDRLYFWSAKRGRIGHTGIYMGNGYFVHSSMNHHGVDTDYLGLPKWRAILVAARR